MKSIALNNYQQETDTRASNTLFNIDSTNWLDSQITRFDELLRENFSKGIDEFAHHIFTYLCELTQASRGVFFVKIERAAYLKAVTGYACPKSILKNTIFEVGEGLVGQAAAAQKELYYEDLHNAHCYQEFATLKVNISSLLFLPLVFNGQVYGVLELAYLHNLDPKYVAFLKKVGKNIAITMESIMNHVATQGLLMVTQKQKELLNEREEELQQNLEEMKAMHDVLQQQSEKVNESYQKLEKSNANILESIRYAKRIQEAILPSQARLKVAFTDYFLIYKPRDIVSGDFYWYLEVKGKRFLGVIDCTGHGIPGAFMSMIANTLLNQIVIENQVHQPNLILASLHEKVKAAIRHDASKSKDGMDLMICCMESLPNEQFKLDFAGAKCNLYYFHEGNLQKIKGDRKSIGEITMQDYLDFTNHQITLSKNDSLYLTTDGLIDICDSKRRRFGKQRFEDMINKIKHLTFYQQREIIENEILTFQEGSEQRDDITLLVVSL